VGAGANLGDRLAILRGAMERLRASPDTTALEASPVYETDPVGVTDQPRFLNMVLGIETTLEPEALLAALLEIERQFGRVRALHWGPRTLDLDLLAFEDETRATPFLHLPHPRMLEREFVTVPLRELLGHPRFVRPCWDSFRRQLAALPRPSPALVPFSECLAP
ncbi:MAG: 2-amino-4-hydroxy-6-hydroxymethyldihydropteridine diphosphokinase, partial [Opitutus sp.]